jgi:hypothetical protein
MTITSYQTAMPYDPDIEQLYLRVQIEILRFEQLKLSPQGLLITQKQTKLSQEHTKPIFIDMLDRLTD